MKLLKPCRGLRENLEEAARQSGRSLPSMIAEIAWLRLFGLRAIDYFRFRLYLPLEEGRKRDFLGVQASPRLERLLNRRTDSGLVDDKLISQTLLSSISIPCPKIHAAYDSVGRATGLCPVLNSPEALREFLSRSPYPLFAKPTSGRCGLGCFRAESWNGESLELHDGTRLDFAELTSWLTRPGELGAPGYLFSEAVEPHESLKDLSPYPSSARIVVLLANQPQILWSCFKFPREGRVTDNVGSQETGLVAVVDLETGVVSQAVAGTCARQQYHAHHPDNGAPIEGRELPFWGKCLELVSRGSLLFPNLRIQGWDVAITDSGPVVLEVNVRVSKLMSQQVTRRPLLSPQVRAWIKERGA